MAKWIATSDIHLHPFKSPSRNGGIDRLEHGLEAFRQTLAAAEKENAVWLCLGDIKQVRGVWPQMALEGALAALRKYPNCPKIFLTGNGYHDGTSVKGTGESGYAAFQDFGIVVSTPQIWPRDLSADYAWYFEQLVADSSIAAVSFWPWQPSLDKLEQLKEDSKRCGSRILFGHGLVSGSTVQNGIRLESNLTTAKLGLVGSKTKRTFDLAMFGDVHRRQTIGDAAFAKSGLLIYPGSPYGQSRNETEGGKGALKIDIQDATNFACKIVPVKAPRFIRCDVSDVDLGEDELKDATTNWKGNFVELVVTREQKSALYAPKSKLKPLLLESGALDLAVVTKRAESVTAASAASYSERDTKSVLRAWVKGHVLEGFTSKEILAFGEQLAKKVEG